MADLKRKQLRQFLSGSFNITGSLNVTGSVEFDKNISGSITSTGSFSRLQSDTISVTHSPFASGSGVQALMDATGSYASASTKYVKESQTGSFGSGSDVQNILNTYVQQSESSSFASGSDLQTILAESSSYVVESETGSFASGSDLQVILAESSSYVTLDETGSFASGSDIQVILAESASYLNNNSTSSLGKLTLTSDITSSITSTGSFGRVDVAENTFILGNLGIGTSTQGNRLQVAGDASIVGALDVLNSVSGGLSSTGSFGHVEQLGVKLVDSNQTGSFASGSDLQPILARSSSYMISDETASMGTTTISDLFVQNDITTSGSITAREFKTEFVSSSIIFASGSQIFGDSEDDTHAFSGSVNIGDMVFSGSRVGVSSDLDLLTLSTNSLTINGGIVVDDGANIGVDSDTNLLTLNDQSLVVNGTIDSTGRIDAQSGLQVSGSSLQVGNDLTLNYTSPVSHSLMFVNYTNKTVDLVPAASASGQLVQYNGSGWVITDEIDGGSF